MLRTIKKKVFWIFLLYFYCFNSTERAVYIIFRFFYPRKFQPFILRGLLFLRYLQTDRVIDLESSKASSFINRLKNRSQVSNFSTTPSPFPAKTIKFFETNFDVCKDTETKPKERRVNLQMNGQTSKSFK